MNFFILSFNNIKDIYSIFNSIEINGIYFIKKYFHNYFYFGIIKFYYNYILKY